MRKRPNKEKTMDKETKLEDQQKNEKNLLLLLCLFCCLIIWIIPYLLLLRRVYLLLIASPLFVYNFYEESRSMDMKKAVLYALIITLAVFLIIIFK